MPVVVIWICGRSVAMPCGNQSGSGPAIPDEDDDADEEDDEEELDEEELDDA